MRTQVDQRFENGDPVREYWLARGEGFAVETPRGGKLGHVVDVILDPAEGRIERIVVRAHGVRMLQGRTREIPCDLVAAAVPAQRTFVLEGGPRRAHGARRAAGTRIRRHTAAAVRLLGLWVLRARRATARAAIAAASRLRTHAPSAWRVARLQAARAGRATARTAERGRRWAAPRVLAARRWARHWSVRAGRATAHATTTARRRLGRWSARAGRASANAAMTAAYVAAAVAMLAARFAVEVVRALSQRLQHRWALARRER